MNHDADYPPEYLAGILKEVKTIAMVGASSDPTKFSYGVLRVLHETGYDMIPVNPKKIYKADLFILKYILKVKTITGWDSTTRA